MTLTINGRYNVLGHMSGKCEKATMDGSCWFRGVGGNVVLALDI